MCQNKDANSWQVRKNVSKTETTFEIDSKYNSTGKVSSRKVKRQYTVPVLESAALVKDISSLRRITAIISFVGG